MDKFLKLLNEKFNRLIEEDEKDSDLLSSGEDDLLSVIDLKDFTQEATKIIEDGNWEIWKPKSEQGMVLLSQGTKWLTSHSWNAPAAEYGDVNPESWNFQNWGKAYVIISKDKIDRVTGLPKKFLFQAGWGGMYSPSYARYSFASWLIKLNSPKLIKWAAQSKFPFVSNRLLSIVATDELKKSGGVYTYPSEVYPSWGERGNVTKIIIKPGTTRINAHSFSNFRGITEVEIPDTVTIIGNHAFSRMESLNTIKLPPNLTTIGEGAFASCVNLTTIIIPNKVRKIGESAFAGCSSLKTLFIPNSVKTMGIILKQWGSENTLPNLTIYCEASSKPEGWDENWNATHVGESWDPDTRTWSIADVNKVEKVIWGASKPSVTEEKETLNEEDDALLTLVKDEKLLYEDSEWKIVRPITFDKLIEYAKSEETGHSWALQILKYVATAPKDSVEGSFYDKEEKKFPYVIILNKKNKKNYLFLISNKFSLKTEYVIDTNNEESYFYDFIENKNLEFQNFFKKQFKTLEYNIDSVQQKQKVLKEYEGVYEYPNTEKIEDSAREHYTKIIIKEGTKEIEDSAFDGFDNVKSVNIPESVSVIGDRAFYFCRQLRNIFIPKNVKIIGKAAFDYCLNLKKIYCEAPSKPEGWHEDWDMYNKYMGGKHEVIWGAPKPTVTEEVKKNINEEDGEDEILLTTVSDRKVLLDTPKWKVVRVLSPEAYSEFIKKGNAPIEGRLNHILSAGAEEFYNRTRGVALYVLIDKQSDDRYLFAPKMYAYTIMGYDDYNENVMGFLRNIGTDEALQNWFKRTFTATTRNIEKLQQTQAEVIKRKYTYVYPDDEPIEYRDVAEQIKIVTITEGTTEIKDYAFNNFKGVKEIIIPKSVKKIGKYAFSSCNSLISIVIPEGVTKIEENTFWGCHRLEKVTLSNTITEIGDSAFWSCDKLWEINIPRSVTKIGDAAFLGCHTLPELFIPASVQTIGTQGIEIRNSYYDTAGYGKATIYCEAQSKPSGWNDSWTTPEVEVVWGAKPSLREEKEIDLEPLPYIKPEFKDNSWVVINTKTEHGLVKLIKDNLFEWKPSDYTHLTNGVDGYMFFQFNRFTFKEEVITGVINIFFYDPSNPKKAINKIPGSSFKEEVDIENLLYKTYSYNGYIIPYKGLKDWFTKKFPKVLNNKKFFTEDIELEVMPYAKPEFEADGWVVMSIGTRAAPVELANGKVFDWDPIRYTSEQNEEALTDDGYVFFSFKPNGATVEDIYLYEPMYPNDINIYQGGSVPMSNLLNYAESDKLRKWVINKFPEYKDDMIEHMVGYMVF